jgi:ferrochelatase
MEEGKKTAVLLLNMGGPDSEAAVRPFLFNLFADRNIIGLPAPLRYPLAYLLCTLRAAKVRPRYRAIGGKSPLPELTAAQGRALTEALAGRGMAATAYPAFSYWYPLIHESVDRAIDGGAGRIVALSLYPQYCRATTGTCLAELHRALRARRQSFNGEVTVVDRWPDHPGYLDALAGTVKETLAGLSDGERRKAEVLFSAHGVPLSLVEKGDPYREEVERTVAGVMGRLGSIPHRLAFQSALGPMKWLAPSLADTLSALAKDGAPPVVVVPLSFVSDHVETLYELDIQYAELARSLGFSRYLRAPALNTRPDFIAALADLVLTA